MIIHVLFVISVLDLSNDQNSTKVNSTQCGLHYCDFRDDMDALYDIEAISDETQFVVLALTYLLFSVLACILVAKFLDPLSRYKSLLLI